MKTNTDKKMLEFRIQLQQEFSRRCRTNSRYSLRAFARQLDIDSSSLSQILSGKRKVSEQIMDKIYGKIGFTLNNSTIDTKYKLMSEDAFAAISDWYHYAIMDLTLVQDFRNDPEWIASKLNVAPFEIKIAIERLIRLEVLVEENGTLKLSQITNSNYAEGQTSLAHKEYQRQIITKALHAVDNCPQGKKDITSMTIAANSAKLKLAKEKIRKFRRELCAFLEDGEKDSVYQMAIQLYPLTSFETSQEMT